MKRLIATVAHQRHRLFVVPVVCFALLVASCAGGLSAADRAEVLRMCVGYQQRVDGLDFNVGMELSWEERWQMYLERPTAEYEQSCTPLIDTADDAGCDRDATIRYIAASFGTRPHEIRHEEVWSFGFVEMDDPSEVLQEC